MHAGALALGAGVWGAVQALVRCAPTASWIADALESVSAELVITLLYITVETTAWNTWPVHAYAWAAARSAWCRFYDVGIVCAGVCLVAMFGMLLTMCTQLFDAPPLAKRSVQSEWTLVPVVRAQLTHPDPGRDRAAGVRAPPATCAAGKSGRTRGRARTRRRPAPH